ncbi:glycosyltransferase family 22 protein [Stipitochalara longipes BDJ]|nr:glycosyltransferase family 22 protein [Stipitochalara longipes BDJ]
MASKETEAQAPPKDEDTNPLVQRQAANDVWMMLIVFRFINVLCVATFFQPDEYFQSLEPAWQMAFGSRSGAWITWEWQHQLRSSLHPVLFAAVYYLAEKSMAAVSCFPQFRAMILSILPNVVQGIFAATGDYYTWQLAERIYGIGNKSTSAVLFMTMFSPWQWFCSTRTFSNSLEATLTIMALYYWPWNVTSDTILGPGSDPSLRDSEGRPLLAKPTESGAFATPGSVTRLRISLALAGTACILRPTNGLIWFSVLMPTLTRFFAKDGASISDYLTLFKEAVICGSAVIAISAASDFYYFGEWTFPPYQWLNFNISQNLAVFYGRNDWHYYLSQGLPLLLTTYLPFTLVAFFHSTSAPTSSVQFILTTTVLVTLTTLSLISHKEVRFIYPLLPLLHILTGPTISSFFTTTKSITTHPPPFPSIAKTTTVSVTGRKPLLYTLLLLNVLTAFYTTQVHQRGPISVIRFLRHEYEALALDNHGVLLSSPEANMYAEFNKTTDYSDSETFVGFLMPCHSTPWRSQLVYPGLKAWALGCEPPLHLSAYSVEREEYRDEADRFYDDPIKFLKEEVGNKERPWPRYIVGFEGIEGVLREYYEGEMKGHVVMERWRRFSSQWHDDERRQGDIVVWGFGEGRKE